MQTRPFAREIQLAKLHAAEVEELDRFLANLTEKQRIEIEEAALINGTPIQIESYYRLNFRYHTGSGSVTPKTATRLHMTICFPIMSVPVANTIRWEINRILKTYRQRWTGTETFHLDGKQNLGMGDCQLRSGQGQTRHMYLVMLADSLLMLQLQRFDAKQWALTRLTTIGQACRAVANETLRTTLQWAMTKVQENSKIPQHVIAQLGLI